MKNIFYLAALLFMLQSCTGGSKSTAHKKFEYQAFKDSIIHSNKQSNKQSIADTSNIFDSKAFIPGLDSDDTLLIAIDTLWHYEMSLMQKMDTMVNRIKRDSAFSEIEKQEIRENLKALDSFLINKSANPSTVCKKDECIIYAEVLKSKQMLYLYIEGELKDSFKVSTGVNGRETPSMDLHPTGPIFTKYTSKKFPGGNYKGLGNMPYAVFIKGGYAIHGTTSGNFSKLGSRASHGCIRIHPDNAKVFSALIKLIGLSRTWVTVKD